MKILQIIYESEGSPFGFGGAGTRAYEILSRLAARHEVTMLCMRYPGARDGVFRGIRHVFAGVESRNLYRSVAAFTLGASRFVRRNGRGFDVIVENFLPTTPIFSCWRTPAPVILQIQGILEGHVFRKFPPWLSLPLALVERYYLPRYRHFMFVSEVTRRKVLERLRRFPETSVVVGNGVDVGDFGAVEPGGGGDTLLFFSRLDEYTKGLDLLTGAFGRLAERFPEMRLVLAGTAATPFSVLRERVPSPYRDRVRYAGFVTGAEKVELLSSARLVVLPSRHESAPISLLEAAAAGRPLVVSDIPELTFVAEKGFGRSFASGSTVALEETLGGLWEDAEGRRTMGRRGLDYARECGWDAIAGRFEEVLERVAGAGPPV